MSKAFGEQNPTQGETPVSWQTWSDGAAGIPNVSGNLDWGKLSLQLSGAEGRSLVYDLGSLTSRKFTLTENRYGAGLEDATLQIRGDTVSFLQDDVLPVWEDYTVPVSKSWRYVQVRETTSIIYYFSSLGDDANDGLTIATPKETIAEANTLILHGGYKVLFNRSETFPGRLIPVYSGTAGSRITYGAYGAGARPIIDGSAASALYIPITSGVHHLRFENIDFSGATGVQMSTVRCFTHDVYFYNDVFRDSAAYHGFDAADGVNDGLAIYNIIIDSCIAEDNSQCGIYIGSPSGANGPHDCLIKNTTAVNNGTAYTDHGIYVRFGVDIQDCICDDNYEGGIKINCEGSYNTGFYPKVQRNSCKNNRKGLFSSQDHTLVINNKFYDNHDANILLTTEARNGEYYGNTTVNDHGGYGWQIGIGVAGNIIKNNINVQDVAVVPFRVPFRCTDGHLATIAAANTIDYNVYYYDGSATNTTFGEDHDDVGISFNTWKGYAGSPDANSTLLPIVPGFVTRYTDFQPKELGNLIGLGIAVANLPADFNGVPRTDPPTPGCYDFTPPTPVAFDSGEVGSVGFATVVVTFSDEVLASNYTTGVTIKEGAATKTISSATRQTDKKVVRYILSAQVAMGATVTWEYSAAVGDYSNLSNTFDLATTTAQAITNNVDTTVGSRSFDGSTDRIDWATISTLTGAPLTISMWVYCVALDHDTDLFVIHQAGAASGILIWINSAWGIVYFQRNGATDLWRRSAVSTIATGAWFHLLVTHTGTFTDATTIAIYKDGVAVTYLSLQDGATEIAPSGGWSLGGLDYSDAANHNGYLAQVRVFDRVLNATEIAHEAAGDVDTVSGLLYYFKANTASLLAAVGGLGVADGTSYITGAGNGPVITYPD